MQLRILRKEYYEVKPGTWAKDPHPQYDLKYLDTLQVSYDLPVDYPDEREWVDVPIVTVRDRHPNPLFY